VSWIKKGPLARLVGGSVVVWLIVFFGFDPVLKFAFVKAGQAAAGAKVEIASLRTKWLSGTLELRGIAIADKNQPMKNVVEFSRAAFSLDVGQALRGKGVVREAALEGLRIGTARRTSGALPRHPAPSKIELAVDKAVAPVEHAAAGETAKVKSNAVGTVDATKLQGIKKLDEAKAKSDEIQARWKGKAVESQDIAKQAQAIADDVKTLDRGGDPLKKIAQASADQKKLKDLIARVDAQRAQAKKDLDEIQASIKEADALRGKDVNGLLSAAGMPTLDSQDLARRLLGAQTASRLATALHWMRWARERAAAKKAAAKASASAAPPAPRRRAGVDVEFPLPRAYPQFLLERAKLSGTLEDLFMGQAMTIAGVLNGVTSNPELYGKPALLTLTGEAAGGTSLKLSAELDQQDEPVGVAAKFDGSGFSLAGAELGDREIGGTLAGGSARVSGEIRSAGDEWKGAVRVEAKGVKLEPKVALSGAAGALVSDALKSLNGFTVDIGISGKESDLKLTFKSNIGDVVAAAMKKAFAGQFEAQRKALQAQVDALYNEKLKGVRASADGTSSQVLGPLDDQKAALDKQLQDALKKSLGGKGLDLKKIFR
jgi:uncharacterized protein (TIGR03545 family)